MKHHHLLLSVTMTIPLLISTIEAVIRNSVGSSGKIVEDVIRQDKLNHENAYRLIDYPALNTSIDRNADPCVDFYAFVCSGWKNMTEIGDDETSFNQFRLIGRTMEKRLQGFLLFVDNYVRAFPGLFL